MFDSFEDFNNGLLGRVNWVKLPPAWEKGTVLSLEEYLTSIFPEEHVRPALKAIGADVRVARLIHGKGDKACAVIVLVRGKCENMRAIGFAHAAAIVGQ